jgi:hypothetical protein
VLGNWIEKFEDLDAWKKIALFFSVPTMGFIFSNVQLESPTSDAKAVPRESQVASPTPISSPSKSLTSTDSTAPESPLEFRFAALRDLADLRKDVMDARAGISGDGLGKFYWNVAEIRFNLAQLESLEPREEYERKWNQKLGILKSAIARIDTEDEGLTISGAKTMLSNVLAAIPALESIATSLAN